METDRRVDILGDRLGRDPADIAERRHPDDPAGSAPERRAPAVLAGLKNPVEERLLVEALVAIARGVFERLGVVEILRRLDESDGRIVEVAERPYEKLGRRDVVGVEDCHEVGLDLLEGVVDVAGLGVVVCRAAQVAGAQRCSEACDLRSVAVVEHPGLVLDLHRHGGGDRRGEDVNRLVVGRNENGDAPGGMADGMTRGQRVHVPEREREEGYPKCRVELEDEERQ